MHGELRLAREALVWKLDGLARYEIRRPLTVTGTNLLGLVKNLATWKARYFGEVLAARSPGRSPGGMTAPPAAATCA